MSKREYTLKYRCNDDCRESGCPYHVAKMTYNSTVDTFDFETFGGKHQFRRGDLFVMVDLLVGAGFF